MRIPNRVRSDAEFTISHIILNRPRRLLGENSALSKSNGSCPGSLKSIATLGSRDRMSRECSPLFKASLVLYLVVDVVASRCRMTPSCRCIETQDPRLGESRDVAHLFGVYHSMYIVCLSTGTLQI